MKNNIFNLDPVVVGSKVPIKDLTMNKALMLRKILAGEKAIDQTVSGNAPLVLSDAVAHAILSLKQYGLCKQDGTPTPDAPVDIVCNNGALKYGALGANLYDPSTAMFEVGYYYAPTADGAKTAAPNNYIYNAYIPIEAGEAYVFYGRRKSGNNLSQYNRIHWYDVEKTYISTSTYVGGTMGKGVAPGNAAFARLSCNPQGLTAAITEETVLGYNWTFCKGTAEIVPFVPFVGGVKPVGTPEVLMVGGANLFDASSYTEINAYVNANTGVLTAGSPGSMTQYCAVIPCKPNTQYNITGQGTSAWGAFPSDSIGTTATAFGKGGILTTGANDRYLIGLVRANGDSIDYRSTLAVQEAQTVTDIPMLLAVGNYKDEAELIHGLLTHKVGVYVFTGQETVNKGQNVFTVDNLLNFPTNSFTPFCTRYEAIASTTSPAADSNKIRMYVTQAQVRRIGFSAVRADYETGADLAAEWAGWYREGRPMILVYPLATETTEQTTAHNLSTHGGTNIVDVVSNVTPTSLEIVYKKKK